MAATTSAFSPVEEDSVVYVYDRRSGSEPEKKITLGGVFSFNDFKDLIKKKFDIADNSRFVIATTNRDEIHDETYEELVDDGDTLYLLNHIKQTLPAPAQERVEYLPHFDTLIRSGMYEYYASEGQNPLPFAIAELIDNSLAATSNNEGARIIEIRLYLDETGDKNMVAVMDNGRGMTSRELNNWAIYRLSKFNRKRKKRDVDNTSENNEREEENIPLSLNSDISYFGVGGKQAVFFIGDSARMISKPKDSKDVHEMTVSREEFERREKNREAIYSGIINNRQPGECNHALGDDENIQELIKEESRKESFTHVIITGIRQQHIRFLKEDFSHWSRQLAHIYHYYIHGPLGNQSHLSSTLSRAPTPFKNIDISITMYKKGHIPRQRNLRDISDDQQSNFIESAVDTFEFNVVVEGTGLVEGLVRYHPFLYDRETYPVDCGPNVQDPDEEWSDYQQLDPPARGNRAIFECYWNGRLIPYTSVHEFDWCSSNPKKRSNVPAECFNRISGVLFANSKFEVSTNKLTFIDLEMKLKDKNAVFQKIVAGQPQRTNIERQFTEWLLDCHKRYDKQICYSDFVEVITRKDLPRRQQGPWSVFETIEWEGKTYRTGQVVRTQKTKPLVHGTIQRFMLLGDFDAEVQNGMVFGTGGEFELTQEPRLLYNETKIYPLGKLDREAQDKEIKKCISDEEGKLPEFLEITWPEGNEIHQSEKRPAGKRIGPMKVEIRNRKGQAMGRLPGSQHSSKKLQVEMKIIWNSTRGDKVIVTYMSQHHKNWAFWFREMDIVRDLGPHTLKLQVVLNEEGTTEFGGRLLPYHKINFTVTEAPPSKFSFGMLESPFRVDIPFSIPLQLQDEFNNPTKPTPNLRPELQASGLELTYEGVEARGTTLLVKGVKASGDIGTSQGKNFTLQVTVPGLMKPTQQLKIRLLPGEPHEIIVPTFDRGDLCVENGKALPVSVEIRDRAGNISMHSKLIVHCKFIGTAGLPTYSGDLSNSGKATLMGKPIYIKNIAKKSQKITAKVELPHFRGVSPVEKVITVKPSTRPCNINILYPQQPWLKDTKKGLVKMKPQEEIEWTAGEQTWNIVFALFDEGGTHLPITRELASKFKFNWLLTFDPADLMDGRLPPIKVPDSVGDPKFCQLSLKDGSDLEFSFYIKPVPGEPTQIKCVYEGSKKLRLGETMEDNITVHVTDAYGNSMKKLPHGSLSNLTVTAQDLDTKALQKVLLPNVGFLLRNIKFEGTTLGPREITVSYKSFTDYVHLQLLSGRPSKLAVIGWSPDETLVAYSGSQISRALGFRVYDNAGNVAHDVNHTITFQAEKSAKISGTLSAKPDKNGEVDFGRLCFHGPVGMYKLYAKMSMGRSCVVSPPLTLKLSPDPNQPQKVQVDFKERGSYMVGELFPDFDVHVMAEDGSTMTSVPPSQVAMRLWKGNKTTSPDGSPPVSASTSKADESFSQDEEGHVYFQQRPLPQEAGDYWIVFQATVAGSTKNSSSMFFKVQPGPPAKLVPETVPKTLTVTNTPGSHSRTLVHSLNFHLVDAYGNMTGQDVSGSLEVHLRGGSNGTEVPCLHGNKHAMQFSFHKGCAHVENVLLQEKTPGRDGNEYSLHFILNCRGVTVDPYILPFLFYNDVKKQQKMAHLSKERDSLNKTIQSYKEMFEGKQQLLEMFRDSVEDGAKRETKIRQELKQAGVKAGQMATRDGIAATTSTLEEKMEQLKNKPRRTCRIPPIETHDKEILGKIGHLAEVEDENEARVISWHMSTDLDCVLTTTMAKSKEVLANSRNRQQVLPIDTIFKRDVPEWDRPLPHRRISALKNVRPRGNPTFVKHLLKFKAHHEHCKIAFGLLAQDTIILDTLDDATAYRQLIVQHMRCPTLLTRDGHRIRSNGKFGGTQNFCPPDLRGFIFGAPPPDELFKLERQIELLQELTKAVVTRENAQTELSSQAAALRSDDMMSKQRECQEAEEQLTLVNQKLKLAEKDVAASQPNHSGSHRNNDTSRERTTTMQRGTSRRSASASVGESPRSKRRKP
ncbi:structural maintenance of chromosomes flexible hinge domain-containing protein 1-like [Diadema setosum]|uniref:structural maintenance of chromosomes flexible hinge domain-containing protein 1-like n=1 Tax=Diadema setosum TaxID=31175 RepID=UPI003B3A3F77